MSLAGKTLNGLKWSYVFTVINVASQLGLTIFLARLLAPNDYGLITMGNVVLRFGSYFAQMGIGQSLIQRNEIHKSNVFTAYVLSFGLSLFFYLVIFLLAPLSHYLFANPKVTVITRVLAVNLIFSSVAAVSISLLRIGYKYRLLGMIDFISFVAGNGVVAILMALHGYGVWSLVFAALVQGIIQLALVFYYSRSYFGWQKVNVASAKKLLGYGSRYTTSTFLEVITYSADYAVVGHFFKEKILGIYNRATLLVHLPSQYISANLIKVLFPTLNEVKDDNVRFIKYYQSVNLMLGFVLFGVCIFISLNAPEIVKVLLGEKWEEGIPVLQIIALAVPFNLLINYNGLVYDVYGHLNRKIVLKLCHMVAMLSLFFLLKSKGIIGIAYAYLLTETFFYFIYVAITSQILTLEMQSIVRAHLPFLYVATSVFVIASIIKAFCVWLNLTNPSTLALEMIGTPSLFCCVFLMYPPKSLVSIVSNVFTIADRPQSRVLGFFLTKKRIKKHWPATE